MGGSAGSAVIDLSGIHSGHTTVAPVHLSGYFINKENVTCREMIAPFPQILLHDSLPKLWMSECKMRTLYVEEISRFKATSNFFHTTQHALGSPNGPDINKEA